MRTFHGPPSRRACSSTHPTTRLVPAERFFSSISAEIPQISRVLTPDFLERRFLASASTVPFLLMRRYWTVHLVVRLRRFMRKHAAHLLLMKVNIFWSPRTNFLPWPG